MNAGQGHRYRRSAQGVRLLRLALAVLTLTALSLLPFSASAAEFSGKYLLHVCSSDKQGKELVKGGHTACQAYIAGMLDYHNLIKSLKTAPGVDFCVPANTSLSDLQRIVVRYLNENAQHDGFIASPAVAMALHEAFPCGKRSR